MSAPLVEADSLQGRTAKGAGRRPTKAAPAPLASLQRAGSNGGGAAGSPGPAAARRGRGRAASGGGGDEAAVLSETSLAATRARRSVRRDAASATAPASGV